MLQIKRWFRDNEPELALESVTDGRASFLLRDCDGYRLACLAFDEVQTVCMATHSESYSDISVYREGELPSRFAWLAKGIASGHSLFVLEVSEDDQDLSTLPLLCSSRLAYIVAKSVELLPAPAGR